MTYQDVRVVAQATDVRLVGASRLAAPHQLDALEADDLSALAGPAADYGVDVSDFELRAVDGDTRLLTATTPRKSVYTVLTGDAVAFSTSLSSEDAERRAGALWVSNPSAGVDSQFVFTDEEHRSLAEKVDGLEELAPGVFVDRKPETRAEVKSSSHRALPEALATPGDYTIQLPRN